MLPPGIKAALGSDRTEMLSNQTTELVIVLRDGDGAYVGGAEVAIDISSGSVSKDGISPYDGKFISDAEGKVEVLYLPPPVSSRSTVIVSIEATRSGLTPGRASLTLIVEPAEGGTSDHRPSYVDPQRPYYIAGFVGLILLNTIVLAALIGLALLFRKMEREAR
jgi:hypothetical protein